MSRGLVTVTGATGFLGRHLVPALVADGWRIRVLARRDVIHPLWRDLEVEVVPGELGDERALDIACSGADLIVHAAGLIKARSRSAFFAVNADGARRVAERAQGAMLLISSLAAREPGLSDYAASKRAGEIAAQDVLGDRLTIVRPPALYGPGDPETLPLFQLAAASPVLPVLDPKARMAMMHVEDAARQIAALTGAAGGQTVTLSDGRPEGYGWREVLQTAAEAFGRRPRVQRIPSVALKLVAALGVVQSGGSPPMLTFGKLREIAHPDWSVAQAERAEGLPPSRFNLAEGFLHTILAYEAAGVRFHNPPVRPAI
ncbi:NAD(P)-dependent oxidoreductase [Phenylobacterium sp.]|uniref:NAD-dependent epimerase/dehydratase family protein n=1 Tax=Phenylobacterium sp. TaxID=1871053 RepID=UPI002731BDB6|nr:NAD-dependent epimerase/dehydratase family protein [Phenylobacterium sp.]MDP1618448.1 NAD-dependent epimerase/dehydratase family protein [Phenylobacterium sp.]MDP1988059.1 NAD-dependent epimerase/dehydratase family protein [Phenylobacterium sp.]